MVDGYGIGSYGQSSEDYDTGEWAFFDLATIWKRCPYPNMADTISNIKLSAIEMPISNMAKTQYS